MEKFLQKITYNKYKYNLHNSWNGSMIIIFRRQNIEIKNYENQAIIPFNAQINMKDKFLLQLGIMPRTASLS